MGECCSNSRTQQKCRLHPGNMLTLFCAQKTCMEPLCALCKQKHKRFHRQNGLTDPQIIDIRDLQDYSQQVVKKQLRLIKQCKDKYHKPEQAIYCNIDNYFYGGSDHRELKLNEYQKQIKSNFTAGTLVKFMENAHEYRLKQDFKTKYWALLQELSQQAKVRNAPK